MCYLRRLTMEMGGTVPPICDVAPERPFFATDRAVNSWNTSGTEKEIKVKRNPDTKLSSGALYMLGEYIASRADLDGAEPKQIELALKKAGKIPAKGDHFYTAYHAALKAMSIRRRRDEALKAANTGQLQH
jgi:hypothetical protein